MSRKKQRKVGRTLDFPKIPIIYIVPRVIHPNQVKALRGGCRTPKTAPACLQDFPHCLWKQFSPANFQQSSHHQAHHLVEKTVCGNCKNNKPSFALYLKGKEVSGGGFGTTPRSREGPEIVDSFKKSGSLGHQTSVQGNRIVKTIIAKES
ncbi:MAG: hypothetical protein XD63_0845 [Thermoanaerobacterales bacterium 50_218]|nr:MAG: hypothetical protein XD63_0845 [Thermoanaerobacterales bacterium 50_218]